MPVITVEDFLADRQGRTFSDVVKLLTPVKDSTSPVQRFQPSRRSYDSRIGFWISCCFLNEFHCFSDSVG